MNSYASKVIEIEKKERGVIRHKIKTEENEENKYYAGIRCGLSWPAPSVPAFYVILGQEYIKGSIYKDKQKPPPRFTATTKK